MKAPTPTCVVTALLRGAFEYQGQKCSAASRAYIPENLAAEVKKKLVDGIKSLKMGSVEDFSNFVNAVIDERSFNKIKSYLDKAKQDPKAEILVGGECDSKKGWFVQPTVIEAKDPHYVTMCEEIFGPVSDDLRLSTRRVRTKPYALVTTTSPYALTGSIIAKDRAAIHLGNGTACATPPAISISTTNRQAPSLVSNPLAGARGSGHQ
jgi:1-pyrroline-5-carboxylate dehydrogenase